MAEVARRINKKHKFVADGIFAEEARENGRLSAPKLARALEENGVHATYAMDTLAW